MSHAGDPLIRVDRVSFSYRVREGKSIPVLHEVSFEVHAGEHVAVIGHNGSGKSTLAKHLNGLLVPESGDVFVDGMNTRDKRLLREIRKRVGMVFQHPDNQMVATIVEDDVAFGLENLGVPEEEMHRRVDEALRMVGMEAYRHRPPHQLSGGQKQRVAIAGILAMRPRCIVLDEATSMLDSYGRQELMEVIQRLHREGIAIVSITHHMQEVALADRVLVMEAGRVVIEGTPREVFRQRDRLLELQLDVPGAARVAALVHEARPEFREDRILASEVVEEVQRLAPRRG
ncbi:MAG: energy-coupling factor transporter ATPase [Alicyclobacillus macrosporangiidus]|uniref:energy-coupling factor transporter ATPase n=1 Tax=Alicyclobacillus macrosporangiidus TaxID=392015 RepID=UPI0026ED12EF|nr:energy-coupling factor transporter ATPase [Alicyclobacillus macrosporangiidus]MCL6600567.1 energy-coupling factor transporter ATPase [Alicyclobacillus macrosporangiidus]